MTASVKRTMMNSINRLTSVLSVVALVLFGAAIPTSAFVRPSLIFTAYGSSNGADKQGSSTQANVFGFLNDGKKALVKSLAGEYDQTAIKARMEGLIADNKVLMFSFTTCPFW